MLWRWCLQLLGMVPGGPRRTCHIPAAVASIPVAVAGCGKHTRRCVAACGLPWPAAWLLLHWLAGSRQRGCSTSSTYTRDCKVLCCSWCAVLLLRLLLLRLWPRRPCATAGPCWLM
jgi:hypothetical protein